jgi:hypothetical protein
MRCPKAWASGRNRRITPSRNESENAVCRGYREDRPEDVCRVGIGNSVRSYSRPSQNYSGGRTPDFGQHFFTRFTRIAQVEEMISIC